MAPKKEAEEPALILRFDEEGAKKLERIAKSVDRDLGDTVNLAISILDTVLVYKKLGHRVYVDLARDRKLELVIRSKEESELISNIATPLVRAMQNAKTPAEKQKIIKKLRELIRVD